MESISRDGLGSRSATLTFERALAWGNEGEQCISKWLVSRGLHVLPVYDIEGSDNKGPRLFGKENYVLPDILAWKAGGAIWIEAKRKSAFAWYRIGHCWTTGIDLHHYKQYQRVQDITETPVWLLFLQMGGQAKDSPPSPSGLYGNCMDYLREHEDHRSEKWGRTGMVYWSIDNLKRLAELDEVQP